MERTEVIDILTEIFRKVLGDQSLVLSPELTANDTARWDSLSHMMLISEIESVFAVRFKLKDLNKMRNVGDMVDIIILKLSA